MANTTLEKRRTITITGLDADWDSNASAVHGNMKIKSFAFYPSAANDRMIIRNKMIGGEVIFDSGLAVADTTPSIEYQNPPEWFEPFIDISECTLDTAANCKVIIKYV